MVQARRIFALLGLSSLLMTTGCQDVSDRAAQSLISQFGNACVSRGAWTELAMQQNKGLRSTLEELKQQAACKPFESQLATIQSLSTDLARVIEDPKMVSYFRNKAHLADLSIAFEQGGKSLPADLGAAILQSATENELEVGKLKANYNAKKDDFDANYFKEQTANYVKTVQSMMANMPALQECLLQSPVAAMQLSTQLLTVAGSTASPATGASLSTIGQLMNLALSFGSDSSQIARAEYRSQKDLMPQGLSCAMEAMTELYCQAEDAKSLLQFQAESYRINDKQYFADPIFRGTDILSRRLPVLAELLRRIRNGTSPGDIHDAARKVEATSNVIKLFNLRTHVEGRINKTDQLCRQVEGPDSKKVKDTYLLSLLQDLSSALVGESTTFNTFASDPKRNACMLALDPDPQGLKCPTITELESPDTYLRKNFLEGLSIETISRNWGIILDRASQMVDLELAQQITLDPKLVITSMMEPGPSGLSAVETLKLFLGFLDDLNKLRATDASSDWNPLLTDLIEDTRNRISMVIDVIERRPAEEWKKVASKDIDRVSFARIYDIFQLRLSIQFIPERIKKLVEWDLNRRLRRGELPATAGAVLVAMGGGIGEHLGTKANNLDPLKMDIDNAQSLTQSNLSTFMSFFGDAGISSSSIDRAKESLLEAAKQAKEPHSGFDRPNGSVLARLCVLSLISRPDAPSRLAAHSDLPDFSSEDPCRGALLESVYAQVNQSEAKQIGFSLTLAYDDLFAMLSGQGPELYPVKNHQTLRAAADRLLHPEAYEKLDRYDSIFKATVSGNNDVSKEQRFSRKVCTFHRFLRASRIIEALPTLDPRYREVLMQ